MFWSRDFYKFVTAVQNLLTFDEPSCLNPYQGWKELFVWEYALYNILPPCFLVQFPVKVYDMCFMHVRIFTGMVSFKSRSQFEACITSISLWYVQYTFIIWCIGKVSVQLYSVLSSGRWKYPNTYILGHNKFEFIELCYFFFEKERGQPPPLHSRRIRGYLCSFPITWMPLHLGNKTPYLRYWLPCWQLQKKHLVSMQAFSRNLPETTPLKKNLSQENGTCIRPPLCNQSGGGGGGSPQPFTGYVECPTFYMKEQTMYDSELWFSSFLLWVKGWGVNISAIKDTTNRRTLCILRHRRAPPRVGGQTRHCQVRHRQAYSQLANPCMPYRRAGPGPRTDWEAESANTLSAQHVRAARQVLTPNMASLLWRCDVNA